MERTSLDTPVGPITLVGDECGLYALTFEQGPQVRPKSQPLIRASEELHRYFEGKLLHFSIPLILQGTPFQRRVWKGLSQIPWGTTCSYRQLAESLQMPSAYRAVARANGANRHPILIPCHRVIYHDGTLGGYSSGVEKKQWLLEHELKNLHVIT